MIMENNNNAQEQVFISLRRDSVLQQAIHLGWDDLSDTFSELLSGLLCREITAEAEREEYYYWRIVLRDTPLDDSEMDMLLELADAVDLAGNQYDFCEEPVTELFEDLCNNLINRILPYNIVSVNVNADGVWFIGEEIADRSELKPLTQEQIAEYLRLQRPVYHFIPGDPDGCGWVLLSPKNPDDWDYGKVDGYGTEYIAYDREPDTNWPF